MHPLRTNTITITISTTTIIVVMAASFLTSNATGFVGNGNPTGVVYPGGCYLQSELIRCALDQSHCEGLVFRSSRQMKEMQMFGEEEEGNDDADRCRRPHPDYVGMCTSGIDKYHCTGHDSGCVIASKFVPNIPYCTIRHNHFPGRDTHLALYGSCTSIDEPTGEVTRTCVWSIDDCPGAGVDPAINYAPSSFSSIDDDDADAPPCTCDLVKTGACVLESEEWDTGRWTCAVSADACDSESSFRTRKQVEESGRDCRLCDVFDKTVVVSTERVHSWRTDHHHHHHSSSSISSSSPPAAAGAADDDFDYHLEYHGPTDDDCLDPMDRCGDDHDHDHSHTGIDDDHDHDHSHADDDDHDHDHDHDHSHADDDGYDHDHDHDHSHAASAFLNGGGDTCRAGIVAASAVGSVLIALLVTLIALVLCRDNNNNSMGGVQRKDAADTAAPGRNGAEEEEGGEMVVVTAEKGGTMA